MQPLSVNPSTKGNLLHSYECSAGTFHRYQLANGAVLQVLRSPNCPQGIHGRIDFHAGYAFESPQFKEGTAHFFEHLIGSNMSSPKGEPINMNNFCAHHGVVLQNMQTSSRSVFITCFTPYEDNIDGILKALTQPPLHKIDDTSLETERLRIRQEQAFLQSTPEQRSSHLVTGMIYPTFHRASGALGNIEDVNTINLEELQNFQEQHVRIDNSIITLVGNLPEDFLKRVEERMSNIIVPNSPLAARLLKVRNQKSQNIWESGVNAKQTIIFPEQGVLTINATLCFPSTIDFNSEAYADLFVLGRVLSGCHQLSLNSSTLAQSGICYAEYSKVVSSISGGHFEIGFVTNDSELTPLSAGLSLVKSNLLRVLSGDFDAEIIDKRLESVLLGAPNYLKDTINHRDVIADAGVLGMLPENRDVFVANCESVTKERLVATAQRFFDWNKRMLIVRGNPEKLSHLNLENF